MSTFQGKYNGQQQLLSARGLPNILCPSPRVAAQLIRKCQNRSFYPNTTRNFNSEIESDFSKIVQKDQKTNSNNLIQLPPLQQAKSISLKPRISLLQKKQKNCFQEGEKKQSEVKTEGIIKAYAANTNPGIIRNYNEDRVSIILNITKSGALETKASFFAVYDGHGGSLCAEFLRDNLHKFIVKDQNFPQNPKEAIFAGFSQAEQTFINRAYKQQNLHDKSGSCACTITILNDILYIANVGDSRAIMSVDNGKYTFQLSNDHKPLSEKERIEEAGGKIYQTNLLNIPQEEIPWRVYPGRLSISRSIGDPIGKIVELGGNPNVVIAIPEIRVFKITADSDFVIIASDGIYDRLSNQEIIQIVWNSVKNNQSLDLNQRCSQAVEAVIQEAILRKTYDNVTVVMIAFKNFVTKTEAQAKQHQEQKIKELQISNNKEETNIKNPQNPKLDVH